MPDSPHPSEQFRSLGVIYQLVGEFVAPHGVGFDAAGNLYVMDWVSAGRITKLRRLPNDAPEAPKAGTESGGG